MSSCRIDDTQAVLWTLYSVFMCLLTVQGIDVLAGVEAIISHLVVKEFQIPCAHAPALSPLPLSKSLCPKSAAEEVSRFFTETKNLVLSENALKFFEPWIMCVI